MSLSLIYLLDLFGVIVFALTGTLVAGKKQMDLFGGVVLANVTALGGGTIRDLLTGSTPVFWMKDPVYIYTASITAVLLFFLVRHIDFPENWLVVPDAFGLALFSLIGTQKAMDMNLPFVVAVITGILTGVAGGMIRDILSGSSPMILSREIYATAAMAGAVVYLVLSHLPTPNTLDMVLAMLSTLLLRLLAVRFKLELPAFVEAEND
jgi:uncharacterized membrane protein YeiH